MAAPEPGAVRLRASSIDQALGPALGSVARVAVVRGCKLSLALPATVSEVTEADAEALVVTSDATTLAEGAARLAALGIGEAIVAWVLPVDRPGLVPWILGRWRGLRPVALEDACDALRHAGVVDLRVTEVEGALPVAVLIGRAGPSALARPDPASRRG